MPDGNRIEATRINCNRVWVLTIWHNGAIIVHFEKSTPFDRTKVYLRYLTLDLAQLERLLSIEDESIFCTYDRSHDDDDSPAPVR
jgi:hypothetical protein